MASTALSAQAAGSVVKLNLNGAARNFIVVQQGRPSALYDSSCDGTWLLLEDLYEARPWDKYSGGFTVVYNDYAESTLHPILNSDYLALFDEDIRACIQTVKLPYRPGHGTGTTVNSGADGLAAQIFLLSAAEVGISSADSAASPGDGAKLDYFLAGTGAAANARRVAALDSIDTIWWTRSPYCIEVTNLTNRNACTLTASGALAAGVVSVTTNGVRPALVLPGTMAVDEDGTVRVNTAPTLTGPASGALGSRSGSFAVSYTVSDPDGDAVTVQAALDGKVLGRYAAAQGSNTLTVSDDALLPLANDAAHTLTLTPSDGIEEGAACALTFTKAAHTATVTLAAPLESAEPIRVMQLALTGSLPEDAALSLSVTNNAKDAAPVWEDAGAALRSGGNHVFANQSAANGFALNFRLSVGRGASGIGGSLTGIEGAYASGEEA